MAISEPDTEIGAAAMMVYAGSYSNPVERPGFAHFLEHMFFQGTEMYAGDDSYSAFVKRHGGYPRAGTGELHTMYFFHVDQEALEQALDRFSEPFRGARLDPAAVQQGVTDIESEYRAFMGKTHTRVRGVRRATSNPAHPGSRFTTGNLQTLAEREGESIRTELFAFYQAQYSASRMALAVLGRQSLDDLETMIRARFEQVPGDGRPAQLPTAQLFLPEQLGVRIDMTPLRDLRRIYLEFPLPSDRSHWPQRPIDVLTKLLGDEGPGSIHGFLHRQGWLEQAEAKRLGSENAEFLSLRLDLTPSGYARIDDVVSVVFQYIRLLRREGLPPFYDKERAQIDQLAFQFQEPPEARAAVRAIAENLLHYPAEHAVDQEAHRAPLEPKLWRDYLERIRPGQLRLLVLGPGLETDQVDPYYGTHYRLSPLTEGQLERWRTEPPTAALALPLPNPYIPEDTSLETDDGSSAPTRIHTSPAMEVWHQQDVRFGTPKLTTSVEIFAPNSVVDVEHRVLNALWIALLTEELNAWSFPASQAGLSVSLEAHPKGMRLVLSGYQDKQQALLNDLMSWLADFEVDPEDFERIRDRMVRSWPEEAGTPPLYWAADRLMAVLDPAAFLKADAASLLRTLTTERMQTFGAGYFDGASLRLLVHGNVSAKVARSMGESAAMVLNADEEVAPRGAIERRRLPAGNELTLDLYFEHADSAILIYYSGRDGSVREQAFFRLLQERLNRAFNTELRGRQKRGYLVSTWFERATEFPGIGFAVQSNNTAPLTLQNSIDSFLKTALEELEAISEEEFALLKQRTINALYKTETRLEQRSERYYTELFRGYRSFDQREQSEAAIAEITKEALVDFYRSRLLADDAGRLTVRNTGTAHAEESAPTPVCTTVDCVNESVPLRWSRSL